MLNYQNVVVAVQKIWLIFISCTCHTWWINALTSFYDHLLILFEAIIRYIKELNESRYMFHGFNFKTHITKKICNRSQGTQVKYFLTRWVIHCYKNLFHTAYLQLYVHSLFVTNFEVAVVFCVAVTPIILQRPSFTYFFAH